MLVIIGDQRIQYHKCNNFQPYKTLPFLYKSISKTKKYIIYLSNDDVPGYERACTYTWNILVMMSYTVSITHVIYLHCVLSDGDKSVSA